MAGIYKIAEVLKGIDRAIHSKYIPVIYESQQIWSCFLV
jgi:uncharacterized protein YqkB